jgi:shikimate dehydrogenase
MTQQPGRLVLLGHPLGHSLSPAIHNAALSAAGIDLRYEPLDVPPSALDDTIASLRRQRAAGNVTIPYKERVSAACERLTRTATAVGAVNTFWTAIDGALVGDNTDVGGFENAIRALVGARPSAQRVALFGAGGGAAAVLHAIERWEGATVRVYTRDASRAERLLQRFSVPSEVVANAQLAVRDATLVVNATPIGLRDDAMPVSPDLLPTGSAVFDLAYRPGETAFVRAARAAGHAAMDGLHMLVEQAALAFELWFGAPPDRDVMWQAVSSAR